MDGVKKRLSDSLQFRLSFWLSVSILSVAVITGLFAFWSAYHEANELQDNALREIATLSDHFQLAGTQTKTSIEIQDHDADSSVFVQLINSTPSENSKEDGTAKLIPADHLHDGIQTVVSGEENYRVLVKTLASGQQIAVFQETNIRDKIARDSALHTLMPFLLLAPILLFVVARLVRKIFKPAADLANEIDLRSEQELHQITLATLPAEIRPFVEAINRLLVRVDKAIHAQQRFVADAAHELRTPLSALSLQAERLANADMSDYAHERLEVLRQGIERGRSMLDQLLTLARAQAVADAPTSCGVSVLSVYRRILEEMMPLAEVKEIDIGIIGEIDAHIFVSEVDLTVLIKNLVDNAIRYSPIGGRVDLSVSAANDVVTLVVEDNGPGIREEERERIFDPFYRVLGSEVPGSGLGLSIVQTIAQRVGAKVSLGHSNERMQSGLRVMVNCPLKTTRIEDQA